VAARPALNAREAESATTRRTILAVAEALLAAGGESGLSIRELCARAGVTPPTVYHHFGDKRALVDRVVDDCFAAFDAALARRVPPRDPVDGLRWAFDRYVEYGVAHPTHYRLMFQRAEARRTSTGAAAYDRLRRMVRVAADGGRLAAPLEAATRACWCAAHGVTSLVVGGYVGRDDPGVALVRDALLQAITIPIPSTAETRRRRRRRRKP
jgi:AcrR family transcriptional regulator